MTTFFVLEPIIISQPSNKYLFSNLFLYFLPACVQVFPVQVGDTDTVEKSYHKLGFR
jgi:hypothetical protein